MASRGGTGPSGEVWQKVGVMRKILRSRVLIAAALLVVLSVAASTGPAAASTGPAAATTAQNGVISATSGWQPLLKVQQGDMVLVYATGGSWTVDWRNFPRVGPEGYSRDVDATIWQGCKIDPNDEYGELWGALNSTGNRMFVGQWNMFTAGS